MSQGRLLDHEKLIVYQRAREFNRRVHQLLAEARTHRRDLVDQLQRASASVALNIAEGAGEFSPKEKIRFYRIARRSATESAAALDLLVDVEALTQQQIEPALDDLRSVVAMLVRLASTATPPALDSRRATHPAHSNDNEPKSEATFT